MTRIKQQLAGIVLAIPLLVQAAESERTGALSNYPLGSGDKISIQVYGEKELSLETKLTDAGTILYPFLGEIRVAGMTVGQLANSIVAGLKGRYLVDPKVSVSVVEYREFFVNGEVKNPGNYPYQPGLTVQKAVSIAGGFTERASQSSITLLREKDPDGTPDPVDLGSPVSPGDVLTVEQSFF
jgi:polysaccharide export outer membrane protein